MLYPSVPKRMVECHLVQMSDHRVRGVDPDYGKPGDEVSFADGFPILLITEASLNDLNTRLEHPVSMRRFRPNLVVDGDTPYAEDNWQRIRIGDSYRRGRVRGREKLLTLHIYHHRPGHRH